MSKKEPFVRIVACIVLFLISSISVHAETDIEKRKSAERLMTITKIDSMMDETYSQIDRMFFGMTKQLEIGDSDRPIFQKYMSKLHAVMRTALAWDKIKEPIIDSYVKLFTQEELADLIAFYETKTGKSIIEKMPLIMKDSMQVVQPMLVEFLPKMEALSRDLGEELKAARNVQ